MSFDCSDIRPDMDVYTLDAPMNTMLLVTRWCCG
jgi:hypothetical protein